MKYVVTVRCYQCAEKVQLDMLCDTSLDYNLDRRVQVAVLAHRDKCKSWLPGNYRMTDTKEPET
jgi:hypothetical protein